MDAVRANFMFASVSDEDVEEMIKVMIPKVFTEGEIIIQEGDHGDFFYVVEAGNFDITVQDRVVGSVGPGASFGELALVYDCPRAATITSETEGKTWALDRITFRSIIARNVSEQMDTRKTVLQNVPLLESLTEVQLEKLAEAIELVNFEANERIITKGEPGNVFYILKSGTVLCTDAGDNTALEDLVLGPGEYFGERALMTNEPRAANVTAQTNVVAMALDRQAFDELLGPLRDVIDQNMGVRVLQTVPILTALSPLERQTLFQAFHTLYVSAGDYVIQEGESGKSFYIVKSGTLVVTKATEGGDEIEIATLSSGEYFGEMALIEEEPRKASVQAVSDVELLVLEQAEFEELLGPLQDIMNREAENRKMEWTHEIEMNFEDLEILTTLGTGTFGRVKLVRHRSGNQVYALKVLKKAQVVAFKQKQNVLHEKNILAMCDHPNILKLHQTFKDAKNLYLLMELAQGGELFSYLHCSDREHEYLPEADACFYASNVLMALEYLHQRDIVYRDLKPENLLLDTRGYIKVADFGFAKVVTNRTYTLCGTPEYLAPELVLGKGHNKGVDYWALGILIYEMVVGHSPFAASCSSDQMQICRNIVSGRVTFPDWVSESCCSIIEKLLTKDTTKRIGTTHEGTRSIKLHSWFAESDWHALLQQNVEVPWVPTVNDPLDTSNFDPLDDEDVDMEYFDDGSEWDKDF